jgi:hypothetical protein
VFLGGTVKNTRIPRRTDKATAIRTLVGMVCSGCSTCSDVTTDAHSREVVWQAPLAAAYNSGRSSSTLLVRPVTLSSLHVSALRAMLVQDAPAYGGCPATCSTPRPPLGAEALALVRAVLARVPGLDRTADPALS